MTTKENGAGLWVANPHQYGPGKTHIVDDEDTQRTFCGKWLSAVPGKLYLQGIANCKTCLNAIENRAHRRVMSEVYRQDDARRSAERARESQEWKARYAAYLQTPAWREKRTAVMKRAGGMCEGCGKRKAVQVHHTTYQNVCNEFLWELRAVCDPCHNRIHGHEH